MCLEHLKTQVLKSVTHKARALQEAQAQRPTLKKNKRGFALILRKTRSARACCTNNAEKISELYLKGFGGADRHTLYFDERYSITGLARSKQDQRRGYRLWATSSCTSGAK